MKIKKNKGIALILSIIILSAVLAIGLTVSMVMVDKVKISRDSSDSIKAYYVAESRLECELYKLKNEEASTYCDHIANTTVDKGPDYIKVTGSVGNTKRAVKIAIDASAQ